MLGLLLAAPASGLFTRSGLAAQLSGTASGASGASSVAGDLVATRHGAYFLVNGWVLTARDMGLDAPERGLR